MDVDCEVLVSDEEAVDDEPFSVEVVEPAEELKTETRIGGPRTGVTVGVGPP